MKRQIGLLAGAFVVTLALIFGVRASVDALAVIMGVVLGVAASVPTTMLITYALTRQAYQTQSPPPQSQGGTPPVVIVNSGERPTLSSPPSLPSISTSARKWTVIGDPHTDE